jgi:hypothetical protein
MPLRKWPFCYSFFKLRIILNAEYSYTPDVICVLTLSSPVAVAEHSKTWTVFGRSEAVIAGSNPALGMDV